MQRQKAVFDRKLKVRFVVIVVVTTVAVTVVVVHVKHGQEQEQKNLEVVKVDTQRGVWDQNIARRKRAVLVNGIPSSCQLDSDRHRRML